MTSGASSTMPEGVASVWGIRGSSGPRSAPCSCRCSRSSVQPSASDPNPSPRAEVRIMRSRNRSVTSGWIESASRISDVSRPSIGEPGAATADPTWPAKVASASARGSASAEAPLRIAVSVTRMSNSDGWPAGRSYTGADHIA